MPADSRYPRFSLAELLVFVKALDDSLAAPAHVLVIGGAAAALGYGVDVATNDIDLFQGDMERVLGVAARARAVTGRSSAR